MTLFNCFVMGRIDDSMAGIFQGLKEAALTMQQGGGIGHDFSTLRPRGAPVRGVGADASGPLSFMDVWDAMCRTIMSAGSRRGAMMATMRCDHPDIEAFIDVKHDARRLRMFNLSVLATDAFMGAVRSDADWPLQFAGEVYKTVKARSLWDRIMRSTYEVAEPGVIFIDRINAKNNLSYCETIEATNPCGEQPLPPYGACLLGSLNLARFVKAPFTAEATLDTAALAKTAATAVRMMDNVVDVSLFPLEEQRREALNKRRIGLGMTGLADALVMCGLRYGSQAAAARAREWMAAIETAAYQASIELAQAKGSFPLFDRDAYLASGHVRDLAGDICATASPGQASAMRSSPRSRPPAPSRCSPATCRAASSPSSRSPTGARFCSPTAATARSRSRTMRCACSAGSTGPTAALPEAFVTTADLAPSEHLLMQAAVQAHVDSSISKTINVPQSMGFEDFKAVYCRSLRPRAQGLHDVPAQSR